MPQLKDYRLFISHRWKYGETYNSMVKLLDNHQYFSWINYSVPEHDPLIDPSSKTGKAKLIELLDNQIKPVQCVIICAGMYVNSSNWIQEEINIATSYKKPIVAVKPRGNILTPTMVQTAATRLVNWNGESITEAIRNIAI